MRIISETVGISHEIASVLEKNGGRAADSGLSLPFLGSMVYLAGDGDHVDIGSLYGASAIMAAKIKERFNLKGIVYAIDPYDPITREIQAAPQPGMIGKLSATPEEFWKNVKVTGTGEELNQDLELAGRVADFLEFGELLCFDALHREESCGGHFRIEHQTPDGEAKRDDANFAYVAAWEFKGVDQKPELHKEALAYEEVKLATRSYK